MKICIDFDGTIAKHEFPEIGDPVPGAFEWMKKFQEAGADLILWTMRCDGQVLGNKGQKLGKPRDVLTEAVEFCKKHGIEFYGVNENPDQKEWTTSPKVYAQQYIDDNATGCPLAWDWNNLEGRPYVNWDAVGPHVLQKIKEKLSEN
jgi:hypothetical protein